jgi:Flp pilus assembly pilin Flp
MTFLTQLHACLRDERATVIVEYALATALLTVTSAAVVFGLSQGLSVHLTSENTNLSTFVLTGAQ